MREDYVQNADDLRLKLQQSEEARMQLRKHVIEVEAELKELKNEVKELKRQPNQTNNITVNNNNFTVNIIPFSQVLQ